MEVSATRLLRRETVQNVPRDPLDLRVLAAEAVGPFGAAGGDDRAAARVAAEHRRAGLCVALLGLVAVQGRLDPADRVVADTQPRRAGAEDLEGLRRAVAVG